MKGLNQFDDWLTEDTIAALVIREHLMPVEGHDGVIFPATFAKGEGFEGGYNIDSPRDNNANVVPIRQKDANINLNIYPSNDIQSKNICLIDSVGSQANRIEPIFAKQEYAGLIPQVVVEAGRKKVNLLEAGHRAGDALVRCSELQQELRDAFKAVLMGDARPLAKIAPTSLVFGVWDSRDTQAKLPRLVSSTIRAFDVFKLRRSAQYTPALDYVEEGLLAEPEDLRDAEGKVKAKHPYAQRGFAHVPATGTHGGVIAQGGIRRDATLSLIALRLLAAKEGTEGTASSDQTLALRRYILGLALVAMTYHPGGYLRQGCNLVPDPDKPREFKLVHFDGTRKDASITLDQAMEYAQVCAKAFGFDPQREIKADNGIDRIVQFDPERAKADLPTDGKATKKKNTSKKKSGEGK